MIDTLTSTTGNYINPRGVTVRVDQPDCRRRQRSACMPGLATTAASLTTSPKLGVERLQGLSIEPAHRHCTQHGPHMPVQPAHHAVAGGRLHLRDLEPPVKQLIDRRLGSRIAALVELVQQSRPHPLGVAGSSRSGGDRLDEVVPLLRHRVDAGVDAHAQRSARQLLDPPAGPAAAPRRARHGHTLAFRTTYGATRTSPKPADEAFSLVRRGAALGNRTPDLRITR
jgi:hypothetical protein